MHPPYFCGAYDRGFMDGLLQACSGKLSMTRTKCVGDGDGYCEFEVREAGPAVQQA